MIKRQCRCNITLITLITPLHSLQLLQSLQLLHPCNGCNIVMDVINPTPQTIVVVISAIMFQEAVVERLSLRGVASFDVTSRLGNAMQRRGNLPLIILSFQIPTCKVVIPKGRSPRNDNVHSDIFRSQYRCHFSR